MKERKPVFKCKECQYLKRVPSLFDDVEILECSNGNHDTLSIVNIRGGGVIGELHLDGVH